MGAAVAGFRVQTGQQAELRARTAGVGRLDFSFLSVMGTRGGLTLPPGHFRFWKDLSGCGLGRVDLERWAGGQTLG